MTVSYNTAESRKERQDARNADALARFLARPRPIFDPGGPAYVTPASLAHWQRLADFRLMEAGAPERIQHLSHRAAELYARLYGNPLVPSPYPPDVFDQLDARQRRWTREASRLWRAWQDAQIPRCHALVVVP